MGRKKHYIDTKERMRAYRLRHKDKAKVNIQSIEQPSIVQRIIQPLKDVFVKTEQVNYTNECLPYTEEILQSSRDIDVKQYWIHKWVNEHCHKCSEQKQCIFLNRYKSNNINYNPESYS